VTKGDQATLAVPELDRLLEEPIVRCGDVRSDEERSGRREAEHVRGQVQRGAPDGPGRDRAAVVATVRGGVGVVKQGWVERVDEEGADNVAGRCRLAKVAPELYA